MPDIGWNYDDIEKYIGYLVGEPEDNTENWITYPQWLRRKAIQIAENELVLILPGSLIAEVCKKLLKNIVIQNLPGSGAFEMPDDYKRFYVLYKRDVTVTPYKDTHIRYKSAEADKFYDGYNFTASDPFCYVESNAYLRIVHNFTDNPTFIFMYFKAPLSATHLFGWGTEQTEFETLEQLVCHRAALELLTISDRLNKKESIDRTYKEMLVMYGVIQEGDKK